MKRLIQNSRLALVAFSLALPATMFAQIKVEKKDKQVQVITITRTGDGKDKTVIELNGDKVTVNGKDAKDNEDVKVRVMTHSPGSFWVGENAIAFNGDAFSLFNEDPNRAMLGVVTEGNDKGAAIASVSKETSAEKAGLKKGDVITKIDDKKIESPEDVTEAIGDHKPGDKVAITVLREGKTQTFNAELGKYKGISMTAVAAPRITTELNRLREMNIPPAPMAPMMRYSFGGGPRLGLSIQDTDDAKGVKVLEVEEDSNAGKAGLKEGDVITEVDGKAVNTVDDLQKIIREKRENPTPYKMQFKRDGKTQTVEVLYPRRLKTVDL